MCGDISYPVKYKFCLHVIAVEQTDMSTQIPNSYYKHLIKKKSAEELIIAMETGSLNTTSIDCF